MRLNIPARKIVSTTILNIYLRKEHQDDKLGILERQKALYDYNTVTEEAEEKGIEKGSKQITKNFLDVLDIETIALKTGLTIEQIQNLK